MASPNQGLTRMGAGDPTRWRGASWRLELGGVSIEIEAGSSALAEPISAWLAQAFCIAAATSSPESLQIRIMLGEPRAEPPAGARELCAAPAWRVLRDGFLLSRAFPSRAVLELHYPHLKGSKWIVARYGVHWLVLAGRFARGMALNVRYWWTLRRLDRRWLS